MYSSSFKDNRITWLDYGKGMCMLMVILYHTFMYYTDGSTLFLDLMRPTRLLVFFFISGYLIKLESFDFRKMLKSICKKLLFPYFVFTIIIYFPKAIVRGADLSLDTFLIDIFGGYASWFVAALAVSKIVMSIILKFTRKLIYIWFWGLLLVFLGFFITSNATAEVLWSANDGLVAILYMLLGMTYKKYEAKLSKNMRLQTCLSVVLYFILVSIDYFVLHKSAYIFELIGYVPVLGSITFIFLSLFGIWMMVCIAKMLPTNWQWLTYIGRNSLVYYYLNTGLLLVLSIVLQKIGLGFTGNNLITIILFVVAVIILTLITEFINRYAPWMVGNFKVKK